MATLKDVAKEAGLAVTTVSRIINNRGYISDASRKKVEDAMKKLNYQPNELARSLQKKATNTIGLIVPFIAHPYFSKVIYYVERAAEKYGYKLMLRNSRGQEERVRESLEMFVSNRLAGVIICTADLSEEIFRTYEIPIIGYERYLQYGEASVECDNYEGGMLAARHLIDQGCKKIVHLGDTDPNVIMPAHDRGIGFEKECLKSGISYKMALYNVVGLKEEEHDKMLARLVEENLDADGIFCTNDVLAAKTIRILEKHGKRVPEDVKIVGFDDVFISELTSPSLTTIHQPVKEMAELCVSLINDIDHNKIVPKRTLLPVELIVRESTSQSV